MDETKINVENHKGMIIDETGAKNIITKTSG